MNDGQSERLQPAQTYSPPPPYTRYPSAPVEVIPPFYNPRVVQPQVNVHVDPPTVQHVVIVSNQRPTPPNFPCPHCHINTGNLVITETTCAAHLAALFLCIFGCWPCVCIPYCMDSFKQTRRYCVNCDNYLGPGI